MENFSILWITLIEYSFITETFSKLWIKENFFNPIKHLPKNLKET